VSFDAAVYDQTHNVEIRQREFAWLTISGNAPRAHPKPASPVLAAGARVERLAGGFYNISGGAADPAGDFCFVDARWQRIYRWSAAARQISTLLDYPLDPVNLAFDKAGNLIVVGYSGNGTVYTFKPGAPEGEIRLLKAEPFTPRPGMTPVLPVGDYHLQPAQRSYHYVSPDGSTFISAGQDFVNGTLSWGVKSSDLLRAFGLARAVPGKPYYLTDESELTTWSVKVGPDGNLTDRELFADQGGESVAVDERGNVYIAAGQIYIYDPAGKLIDTIEVPERPLQLVFGGKDGQTLFIPARTSLYAVRTRIRGR
jgi:sugar lactone lactonase YvrE